MKFSDYDEGVQYAVDEPHVINESLTLYTTQCHFTTQLRVYDSNEHDGYFYSSILLGNIKSIAFNAGNNAGTVEVYGGVDGQDWALVESFQTKSAYADYEVNFANVTYNCFKVEVTGGKQVRFQSLVLTLDENKVASPTFIPSNGTTFTESLTVTASCATEGATIYYTTNGDIPTTGSYVFPENGLTITETTTIKAMATNGELENSEVVEATYTKVSEQGVVEVDLSSKGYGNGTTITEVKEGAITLSFDNNGGTPSAYYDTGTAVRLYGRNSLTVSAPNVITEVAFTYSGGNENKPENNPATIGSYANDTWTGSAQGSVVFTNPNSSGHWRIQKVRVTYEVSATQVSAPKFEPASGTTFTDSLTVTASCATEGATIYYTTNGDIPTTGSYVFPENGLTINETTTIKAMAAMADGPLDPSTVVEATYTKGTQPEDTAFVAQYNGLYYAMATTENDDAMDALVVNVVNNKVVEMANRASISWYVNEGTGRITTAAGLYLTAATSGTALKLSDTATDEGIWTWDEANTAWTRLDKSTTRSFIYNESVNGFKNYAISNIGKDDYAVTYSIPMPIVNGYIREGLVANNYYGTICLPYAVEAEDFAGAEFFSIAGKKVGKDGQPTALVLKEVTELEAGVPYIFSATSEKLVAAYSGEAAETAGSANGLVGSFKGMNVTQGMYLINDENKVQQCGTGCSISTNRAYINMKLVSVYTEAAGANVRMLWFDGVETGIDGVTAEDGDQLVDVYTVGGVKVREQVRAAEATQGLQGGIYIVNRKKVAVK